MEIKHTKRIRLVGRVLAIVMALCLVFCMTLTASADQEEVRDVANGVFYITLNIDERSYARGSGFLINENTIITANHCVQFSQREYDYYQQTYGWTKSETNKRISCSVVISRDFKVSATVLNSSENMDFAILRLSQPIANRKCIALRDSREVKVAEQVYAVGFPSSKDTTEVYNTSDVAFEAGIINKTQFVNETLAGNSILEAYHFKGEILAYSSGTASGGNSGGPLVDANGNAIGVVSGSAINQNTGEVDFDFASASSQIMQILDDLSIPYTKAGDNTTTTTPAVKDLATLIAQAESKNAADYTSASYAALQTALADAKAAATDAEKDAAYTKLEVALNGLQTVATPEPENPDSGSNSSGMGTIVLVIIIVAVAVVILLVIIILIVVIAKKKKPAPAPVAPVRQAPPVAQPRPVAPVAPPVQRPVAPPPAPARPVAPVSNETTVLNQNAGETTVLSGNAGETTVLSQAVNGGTLVRASNNESITISSADFSVGRERSNVDYCIAGNTSISRVHARFIVRNGVTYIVDNKAANGTFVNGVKARAGQEIELKDGDKILLADEKFDFKK